MEARNIAVGDLIKGVKVVRHLPPSSGRCWFALEDGSIMHFAPGDRVSVTIGDVNAFNPNVELLQPITTEGN